jgi:hypothetical protein
MRSALVVCVPVEAERHLRAADENRPFDEVGLFHHQIDRLLLRLRQRPLLEHRAAGADVIQEPIGIDVLFEKRAVRRFAGDVALLDVDVMLLQKTSGVAARRSGGLPVEERLRHDLILAPHTAVCAFRAETVARRPFGPAWRLSPRATRREARRQSRTLRTLPGPLRALRDHRVQTLWLTLEFKSGVARWYNDRSGRAC